MWRFIAAASAGLAAASGEAMRPVTVNFAELVAGGATLALEKALTTDGLVQIGGVPDLPQLRADALRAAHGCIEVSPRAKAHTFEDGTLRRSLAAAAPGEEVRGIQHGSSAAPCADLESVGGLFRKAVALATGAFAARLDALLAGPVLHRAAGGAYGSVSEAVAAGEHLEHFHSYQVKPDAAAAASATLDFHVDQGLFIVFAPAMMLGDARSEETGAFLLKREDGSEVEVELAPESLVVLLGDAADQHLNRARRGAPLRAPSHAFRMPRGAPGGVAHRVWYGKMVLPPADAWNDEVEMSFGDIRRQMLEADKVGGAALALGCSRKLQARELMAQCGSDQFYCWHRCFNHTAEKSPQACQAVGKELKCVSQFGQLADPLRHGDFWPECSTSTTPYSPRPVVEQQECEEEAFIAVVNDSSFANREELVASETYLLWNALAGGKLQAKMVHKGEVGWMAVGIEAPGGYHNGMNGAQVIMGRNLQGAAPTVREYNIHPTKSAFRFWKTPFEPAALMDEAMEVTGCLSSISFTTDSIHGKSLNVTGGRASMIFALTHLDYPTDDFGGYSGYHSAADGNRSQRHRFRGKFNMTFEEQTTTSTEPLTSAGAPNGMCAVAAALAVAAAATLV